MSHFRRLAAVLALGLALLVLMGCQIVLPAHHVGDTWEVRDHTFPNGSNYTGRVRIISANLLSYSYGPDGHGVLTGSDGGEWEGHFENGRFVDGTLHEVHPRGTDLEYQYRNGAAVSYVGTWVGEDLTREVGQWDFMTGRGSGTIDWPDGRHYEGSWRNGPPNQVEVPDGHGTLTWPDGRQYAGDLKDSQPHGLGRMTYPDHHADNGVWIAGQLAQPLPATTQAAAASVRGLESTQGASDQRQ